MQSTDPRSLDKLRPRKEHVAIADKVLKHVVAGAKVKEVGIRKIRPVPATAPVDRSKGHQTVRRCKRERLQHDCVEHREKIAVLAPIPEASVSVAEAVNHRALRS